MKLTIETSFNIGQAVQSIYDDSSGVYTGHQGVISDIRINVSIGGRYYVSYCMNGSDYFLSEDLKAVETPSEILITDKKEVEYNVTINGVKKVLSGDTISYGELVKRWIGKETDIIYSVSYHRGSTRRVNGSGCLLPGQTVELKEGMIFNIAYTGNA